jgi:uncharacterized protein YndB with AHSA1/START domain
MTDTDRIERNIHIAAPLQRVWELITDAKHLGRWFGNAGADVDLKPGGAFALHWNDAGSFFGRVEEVEPPHRVAYRWLSKRGSRDEPTPANSTLIEFTLATEGQGTRLAVVESGFDGLEISPDERTALLADHTAGWPRELGELGEYAIGATAGGP